MKKPWIFRPFEFWPDWIALVIYHLFLGFWCLIRRIWIKTLLKPNYQIPYGGMHFASKFKIQESIGKEIFPDTFLIDAELHDSEKIKILKKALQDFGSPVILKPDKGMVGFAIIKIQTTDDIPKALKLLNYDYLAQKFLPGNIEHGVFWERHKGKGIISGINQKHFPTVSGDGISTVIELARKHPRYTSEWESFLPELKNKNEVLAPQKSQEISSLGSHTMGCVFTDETHIKTQALEDKLTKLLCRAPGYNFGRLDIKSESVEQFLRGELGVIEANGVESRPTHMYDPKYGFWKAMKIQWDYALRWSTIAQEHRKQKMDNPSLLQIIKMNNKVFYDMKKHQTKAEKI